MIASATRPKHKTTHSNVKLLSARPGARSTVEYITLAITTTTATVFDFLLLITSYSYDLSVALLSSVAALIVNVLRKKKTTTTLLYIAVEDRRVTVSVRDATQSSRRKLQMARHQRTMMSMRCYSKHQRKRISPRTTPDFGDVQYTMSTNESLLRSTARTTRGLCCRVSLEMRTGGVLKSIWPPTSTATTKDKDTHVTATRCIVITKDRTHIHM